MQLKNIISSELYQYALQYGVHEHPIAYQLRLETAKLNNSRMQTPPDQCQFMATIAHIMQARNYLEIGVFTGYSTLNMALAMGNSGTIVALENNLEYIKIAQSFWTQAGINESIECIHDDAMNACQNLLLDGRQNSFDIAFIDANKNQYLDYYEYCYQLVRPGGVIFVDNVLYQGEVLLQNPSDFVKHIKTCNEFIYNDARVSMCLLPIADGLTIAYKK